jgi:hypothetical protein
MVCAGRHSFKEFKKEENMLRMEQNVHRSDARLGVGAYDNNEW